MNAVIDQISLDNKTLQFKMYLSFLGNQHVYKISHDEAQTIIEQGECSVTTHEGVTYWMCEKHLAGKK